MLFALLGSELILGFWIRDLLELDNKSTILNFSFYKSCLSRDESKNWRISGKRSLSSRNIGGNCKNYKSCFRKKLNYLIL